MSSPTAETQEQLDGPPEVLATQTRGQKARRKAMDVTLACGTACNVGGRLILRATAIGAAALSALAISLFVALGDRGLSLNAAKPAVEALLKDQTGAAAVRVGSLQVVRDNVPGAPLRLDVEDILFDYGEAGGTALEIPQLSIRFDAASILRGGPMPTYVEVVGAALTVEREGEDLSVGGQTSGQPFDFADFVAQARKAGFKGAILRDLDLVYINRQTGARFEALDATGRLTSSGEGFAFNLDVPYKTQSGRPAALSLDLFTNARTGDVAATVSADRAPAMAVMPIILGANSGSVSLGSRISGTVTAEGTLAAGFNKMGLQLYVSSGPLVLEDGALIPFEGALIDGTFLPETNHFDLGRLEYDIAGNHAIVAGSLDLEPFEGRTGLRAVSFELDAADIRLDTDGLLPEPIYVPNARIGGTFDIVDRVLDLTSLSADYFSSRITGTFRYAPPTMSGVRPGINSSLAVEGSLNVREILAGWPVSAAPGARGWAVGNVKAGTVENIEFQMNLPRNAPVGALRDPDVISLSFALRDATVAYLEGLTPLSGASGRAVLEGSRFSATADAAKIGAITVHDGFVEIADFAAEDRFVAAKAETRGPVAAYTALLDREPLRFLSKAGFDPTSFSGQARADIDVKRPIGDGVTLNDMVVDSTAQFSLLRVEDVVPGGYAVHDASGTMTTDGRSLDISGTGRVEGVPGRFTISQSLTGQRETRIGVEATLDGAAADAFGIPARRFLRGNVNTFTEITGSNGALTDVSVDADLTNAVINGLRGELLKRAGLRGRGRVSIDLRDPDGVLNFTRVDVTAGKARLNAAVRFHPERGFLSIDAPRVFIENYIDAAVELNRLTSAPSLAITGDYFFGADLLDDILFGSDRGGLPTSLALSVALEEVALKGAVSLEDFRLFGRHDGKNMSTLSLTAGYAGGGDMTLTISPAQSEIGRRIKLRTDQFGTLLEGVFGFSSVDGGVAVIDATSLDTSGMLVVTVNATNLVLQDTPTVARLLSVGSLDGLENVLNGDGLDFEELAADIQIDANTLRLVDARLTGSALGLSANGDVDLGAQTFALHGAVAPAYRVNSILGSIPGLGNLLVSRKGEGVFAFAYRVDGPMAAPTISVNALTALTPGIIRRLFEPIYGRAYSTQELLAAAEEEARQAEMWDSVSTPEQLQELEAKRTAGADGAR